MLHNFGPLSILYVGPLQYSLIPEKNLWGRGTLAQSVVSCAGVDFISRRVYLRAASAVPTWHAQCTACKIRWLWFVTGICQCFVGTEAWMPSPPAIAQRDLWIKASTWYWTLGISHFHAGNNGSVWDCVQQSTRVRVMSFWTECHFCRSALHTSQPLSLLHGSLLDLWQSHWRVTEQRGATAADEPRQNETSGPVWQSSLGQSHASGTNSTLCLTS